MTTRDPYVSVNGVLRPRALTESIHVGNMEESGLVTAHETTFVGMSTQSFSNGNTYALSDGITYGASLPGGSTAEINANGLRTTFPTTGEVSFYTVLPTLFASKLGVSRLRRGEFALWAHVHSYVISNGTSCWAYIMAVGGANYPAHCWGTRRTRNVQGGVNNSTGSLGTWSAFNGTDTANVFGGAPNTVGNGSTSHNAADDVVCMYFNGPLDCTWYYGSYSGGWPTFESLKWGAHQRFGNSQATVFNKFRDPATTWGLAFASGQGGLSNSNEMTIARWRLTYWDP